MQDHPRQRWTGQLSHPERRLQCHRLYRGKLLEEPECRSKITDHIEELDPEILLIQEVVGITKRIITDYVHRNSPESMMEVNGACSSKGAFHPGHQPSGLLLDNLL